MIENHISRRLRMQRAGSVLVLLPVLFFAGCASTMKVTVEMIEPVPLPDVCKNCGNNTDSAHCVRTPGESKEEKEKSEVARRTFALTQANNVLNRYTQALGGIESVFADSTFGDFTGKYMHGYEEEKQAALKRIADFHAESANKLEKVVEVKDFDVAAFIERVRAQLAADEARWLGLIAQGIQNAKRDILEDDPDPPAEAKLYVGEPDIATFSAPIAEVAEAIDNSEAKSDLDDRVAKLQAAGGKAIDYVRTMLRVSTESSLKQLAYLQVPLRQNAPFGGFQTVGVHKISPGDAYYSAVLRGKVVGEPFTEVKAGVTGDSTLVLVQEDPTQFRLRSVQMNAEKLMENVASMTDKVMAAWAKYMTGGAAPTP